MRISDNDTLKIFCFEQPVLPILKTDLSVIWNGKAEKDSIDESNTDSVEISTKTNPIDKITPQGTNDKDVLAQAPKPDIIIAGKKKKAGIVVDISTNILYRYDSEGKPKMAYQVASGIGGSTERGIRIITHTEKSPYKKAIGTKRKRAPQNYGPFVICVKRFDAKTGEIDEKNPTGEFIHGCKDYNETFKTDPKRYVSSGCIRMDNGVITKLAAEVKAGEIVIIK